MKNFLVNFFAMSCGVWFVYGIMMGPYIVAIPYYHWNVFWVEMFALVFTVWETMCERKKNELPRM